MFKKKFCSESTIITFTLVFFIAVFILLNIGTDTNQANGENLFNYYAVLAFGSFKKFLLWLLAIFLFGLMIQLTISFVSSLRKKAMTPNAAFLTWLKEFIKISAPLFLILLFISLSLGKINAINKTNLKDELLAKLDLLTTGAYPFISLHSVNYPKWFVEAVDFSFFNFVLFLIAASFYMFYKSKGLFREFASAVCLSFLIAFPVWFFMPALSPQDRFIDNVYKLPLSAQMSQQLKNYKPQEEIVAFLKKERTYKEKMQNMSTSTIPSAHVFWATILGYYLFRTKKLLAIMLLPVLILSTFGTIFFAQHYFVDIPAGIVTAIAAIFLTKIYFDYLRRRA